MCRADTARECGPVCSRCDRCLMSGCVLISELWSFSSTYLHGLACVCCDHCPLRGLWSFSFALLLQCLLCITARLGACGLFSGTISGLALCLLCITVIRCSPPLVARGLARTHFCTVLAVHHCRCSALAQSVHVCHICLYGLSHVGGCMHASAL